MKKNSHLYKVLDATFWKFILVGIANTIVGTAVMFASYNICLLYTSDAADE